MIQNVSYGGELKVARIKMLSLSSGVTRMARIRNEDIRTTHVRYFGDEATEAGLRWFGQFWGRKL